jgi:asparagine N-glycosylation enzyme membrane subunit Stt3
MSINSAVMQIAGGGASVIAGLIVGQSASGMIEHYDTLGYVVCGTMVVMVAMMYYINRMIEQRKEPQLAPEVIQEENLEAEIAIETSSM